jgi:hypothetical protein
MSDGILVVKVIRKGAEPERAPRWVAKSEWNVGIRIVHYGFSGRTIAAAQEQHTHCHDAGRVTLNPVAAFVFASL